MLADEQIEFNKLDHTFGHRSYKFTKITVLKSDYEIRKILVNCLLPYIWVGLTRELQA